MQKKICTLAMLRAELRNYKTWNGDVWASTFRNQNGTLSYTWF